MITLESKLVLYRMPFSEFSSRIQNMDNDYDVHTIVHNTIV